ncbi:MAG: hypothetical protein Q8N44_05145 [Rubrivivax sp.]|nr:hypothetical protein [Rubrivivax sp.]
MTTAGVEKWAWLLIYIGLLVLCLGVFVEVRSASLGVQLEVAGALGVAIGVLMIWLRSRMKDDRQ